MDAETAFHFVGNLGKYQIFLVALFFLGNMMFSLQMVLMVIVGANSTVEAGTNLTTIVTDFNLQHEGWITDLIQSLYMASYMIGCSAFGQASDSFGRRPVLLLSCFLASVVSFCSGFTTTWQTFLVTRCFVGFFVGGLGVVSFVLMTELIGKTFWARIGMLFSCFFSLGICLLAGLGYAFHKWQLICMVSGGLGFASTLTLLAFVPESPRWFYSVGKTEECEKLLRKIAERNGNDPYAIHLSPAICDGSPRTHTIVDIFQHRKLILWLLAMLYIWFSNSLVYYGLTFDAVSLTPNLYLDVALSGVVEIPAVIFSMFAMDYRKIGRKKTLLFLSLLCSISNIIFIFVSKYEAAKLACGLTGKLTISASFAIIYVYTAEIFPTPLRSASIGASSTFARIGAIVAPFVMLLKPTHSSFPYILFGVCVLLSFFITMLLPKTLGKPIPQTIEEVVGPSSTYQSLNKDDNNGVTSYDADQVDIIA